MRKFISGDAGLIDGSIISNIAPNGIAPFTISFDLNVRNDADIAADLPMKWIFGDGTSQSADYGVRVTHTYLTGGLFYVYVLVYDTDGLVSKLAGDNLGLLVTVKSADGLEVSKAGFGGVLPMLLLAGAGLAFLKRKKKG